MMVVLPQTKDMSVMDKKRQLPTSWLIVALAVFTGALYLFSGGQLFLSEPRGASAVTCIGTVDPDPVVSPTYGTYNTSDPQVIPAGTATYTFASPDGIDLTYKLYLPYNTGANQAPTPYPLIVWVPGGFFAETDPNISSEVFYRTFTTEGYAVAPIIQRTKTDADFPAQVEDVRSFIHYIKVNAGRYDIDPDNIFVLGSSSGGVVASILGVTDDAEYPAQYGCYPDVYDSDVNGVITVNGMTDTSEFDCVSVGGGIWCNDDMVSGGNVLSAMMEYVGCDYDTPGFSIGDDPFTYCPALTNAIPNTHAGVEDTTPYLVIHGAADNLVYPQSNIAGATSLSTAGIPVTRCQVDIQSNGGNVPDGDLNDTGHSQRGLLWEKDTIFDFIETYRV